MRGRPHVGLGHFRIPDSSGHYYGSVALTFELQTTSTCAAWGSWRFAERSRRRRYSERLSLLPGSLGDWDFSLMAGSISNLQIPAFARRAWVLKPGPLSSE